MFHVSVLRRSPFTTTASIHSIHPQTTRGMGGGGRAIVLVSRVLPPTICPPQSYIPCRGLRIRHMFARRSYSVGSPLDPPDVPRLAQTARITLTPQEVEEFAPKIRQVVDWFGQLQAVDLHSVEPAIRADVGSVNLRDDTPTTFENRESMIAAVPCYEDPYIKVPKVLKTE